MSEDVAPPLEDVQSPQMPFIPFVADSQNPKDYESAKNYADAVRAWYISSHNWLRCQHQYFLQNNPVSTTPTIQISGFSGVNNSTVNIHHRRILVDRNAVNDIRPEFFQQQRQEQNRQEMQGFWLRRLLGLPTMNHQSTTTYVVQRFTIPPFTRRIFAEVIDFFILFLIKMAIVYFLVEIEVIDLDQLESILSNNTDLQALIDLTQGLFRLEVISKIFSGILEAICITHGFANYPPGCTPGKFIMGLQIVSCLDIQPVPGGPSNRVTITGHPCVNLKNSLIRSLIKNSITNFLFPINAFFYSFNFNRAIYDLAAKTIVVSREL